MREIRVGKWLMAAVRDVQWDEAFDIGSDTLTGVNDADYQPPFPLTATLNKLTIKVDRPQLSPEDIQKLKAAQRNNQSSE